MYEDILVPTDGSDSADSALAAALAVADAHDARLHLLYVADTNQPSLTNVQGSVRDVLEQRGDEVLDDAERRARNAGVETVSEVVQGGPSRTIRTYVDDRGVDLVVMGTRGERDVDEMVLGSVTDRVLRDSPVPVVTVAPETTTEYPPEAVLVGTDGSDTATAAVAEAAAVAAATGAELHLLAVDEADLLGLDLSSDDERADRLADRLDDAAERARERGADDVVTAVEEGAVDEAVAEYVADNGVDLVVLGASGRGGLDRRVLGSTTQRVVRSSDVPVLTVPPTGE